MGQKSGGKHHINRVNILGKSKKELETMVKEKSAKIAANNNITFDRAIKLPNPADGTRFLIMRRTIDDTNSDITMNKVNPIMLAKLIRGVGNVEDMKLIHDGGLLIKAKTYTSANSIHQITRIPGFNVKVEEYTRLNRSTGVIFDRSLATATDEEILDELEPVRCIKVKRVLKTLHNGEKVATGTFFLTFATVRLPAYITLGYMSHKMSPYIPNPTRCFSCQKYGHVSSACKATKKTCVNCGQDEHAPIGEKCQNAKHCVNCDSTDHNSMSRECPQFLYRKKIEEIKIYEQKNHFEATKILDARQPTANPTKMIKPLFSSIVSTLANDKDPKKTIPDLQKAEPSVTTTSSNRTPDPNFFIPPQLNADRRRTRNERLSTDDDSDKESLKKARLEGNRGPTDSSPLKNQQ